MHQLLAGGCNLCEIAAELGLSRNTVRRFARATISEELKRQITRDHET